MPEIPGVELTIKRFISNDPAAGVLAVLDGSGAAENLIAWDDETGDVSYYAPDGTGANTRLHRFEGREVHIIRSGAGDLGGVLFIKNSGVSTVGSIARLAFGGNADSTSGGEGVIDYVVEHAGDGRARMAFYVWNGTAQINPLTISSAGFVTFTGAIVGISYSSPRFRLYDTDGTTDKRIIDYVYEANKIALEARADDGSFVRTIISFFHDGGVEVPTLLATTMSATRTTAGIACAISNPDAASFTLQAWNKDTAGDNGLVSFYTEGGGGSLRGSITYNRGGGVVAYNTTSDYRAKDIRGAFEQAGEIVDAIPVHLGRMKDATVERAMFLAHEVAEGGVPWAVTGAKDAVDDEGRAVMQQLSETALIPILWAEVRALRSRLTAAQIA